MSWYQALAGASVSLSPAARKRLGVDGFGLADTGVVDNVDAIANVLNLGVSMGSLTDRQLKRLYKLEDGSETQAECVSSLCGKALGGLDARIDQLTEQALSRMNSSIPEGLDGFVDWARTCRWEFPVSWDQEAERNRPSLSLGDTYGLCVIEINTESLSSEKRDVVLALVEILREESYKTSVLDQLMYRLDMFGLHEDQLNRSVELGKDLDDDDLLDWMRGYDLEALDELASENDGEEAVIVSLVRMYYETLQAKQALSRAMNSVICGGVLDCQNQYSTTWSSMEEKVRQWESCEMKSFVEWCIQELKGETTGDLFEKLNQEDESTGMPGQYAVVVSGMPVSNLGDVLSEMNEYACSGDDEASVELAGEPDDIVAFLARVTLAERMLLMLAAMSDIGNLSELEQAA